MSVATLVGGAAMYRLVVGHESKEQQRIDTMALLDLFRNSNTHGGSWKASVLVMAAMYASLSVKPASAQSFLSLEPLPGYRSTEAMGISADGSVVVGQSIKIAEGLEAIRWPADDSILGLGAGTANAASSDGSIIVGCMGCDEPESNGVPFRWTESSGTVPLGDMEEGLASAISGDGQVIVGHSGSGVVTGAFRWTLDTGVVDIRRLPGGLVGGGTFTRAADVSSDGAVIVGEGRKAMGTEAIRWTLEDRGVGLGDLTGGAFFSRATAVSSDGSVVVGASTSDMGTEAFRWTESGGMVGLGDLPGGDFFSEALDVSADGSVVVGSSVIGPGDADREAFIWDADNGMRSLRDVLGESTGNLDDWDLYAATAISADGLTITGNGSGGAWRASIEVNLLAGDYNGDGVIDVLDVDLLSDAVAHDGDVMSFDLNGDGILSTGDVTELLAIAGKSNGDADFDGQVGFADFAILAEHYALADQKWSEGDFDSTSVVEFSDFVILANAFEQGAGGATASVPEPTGTALLAVLLAFAAWRRRH